MPQSPFSIVWLKAHAWILSTFVFAGLFLWFACSSRGMMPFLASRSFAVAGSPEMMMDATSFREEKSFAPSDQMFMSETDRSVIKEVSMAIRVESVTETLVAIQPLAAELEGLIIASNEQVGEDGRRWGDVTFKVPAAKLDLAVEGLKALADQVEQLTTNVSDVTETVLDLNARLENKRAEEAQYRSILEKATAVQDVLTTTQYLSNVRYEIESMETQLNTLNDLVQYSRITLSLREDAQIMTATEVWKPLRTVRAALRDWVLFLQSAVDGVIYFGVFSWPLLIGGALLWYFKKRS